jgi:type IV pilus assembly protein PilF
VEGLSPLTTKFFSTSDFIVRRCISKKFLYGFFLAFIACQGCATSCRGVSEQRARALEDLGVSYLVEGELNLAVKHLVEAAEADPENPHISHSLALAYRDLGLFDRAIAEFQRALSLKPDFPKVRNNLGVTYLLMGRLDDAISCFNRAVGTISYATPQYAFVNLGLAYYRKGQFSRAIRYCKEALEVDPSFGTAYENLGLAYEAAGDGEQAREAYHQAISCEPDSPNAYFLLGQFLRRRGRASEAVVMLEKAFDADPNGWKGKEALKLLNEINEKGY